MLLLHGIYTCCLAIFGLSSGLALESLVGKLSQSWYDAESLVERLWYLYLLFGPGQVLDTCPVGGQTLPCTKRVTPCEELLNT